MVLAEWLCLFALWSSASAAVLSVADLATTSNELSSTLAPTPASGASGVSAGAEATPELAIGADVLSKSFGVAIAAWCGCCVMLTVLLQCIATLLDGQASSARGGGKEGSVQARGRKKQGGATPGGDCAQACKQSCKPFVRRWYPCWYECCCRRAAAPAGPDYAPIRTARNGDDGAKAAVGAQGSPSAPPASYAAAQRRARPDLDDASTMFSYEDRNDFDDAASQGWGGHRAAEGYGESYEPA